MRVTSASMHFGASAGTRVSSTVSTRLETWSGSPPAQTPAFVTHASPRVAETTSSAQSAAASASSVSATSNEGSEASADGSPASFRRLLVERLLAHSRIDTARMSPRAPRGPPIEPRPGPVAAEASRGRGDSWSGGAGRGAGAELTLSSTVVREEGYAFSARGEVQTADGRTLRLELDVSAIHREVLSSSTTLSVGAPKPKDPLVLSKTGATLDPLHPVSFDLDGDGEAEEVASLGEGAAFLAIDRDGDGDIGDGTELFGPTTQDGFAELRALDVDGSGWVDEGDAAWSALRLFRPGEVPRTLREANVGALAVQHLDTPFRIAGGAIAASSVYLEEDGGVGAVQHVDLDV